MHGFFLLVPIYFLSLTADDLMLMIKEGRVQRALKQDDIGLDLLHHPSL